VNKFYEKLSLFETGYKDIRSEYIIPILEKVSNNDYQITILDKRVFKFEYTVSSDITKVISCVESIKNTGLELNKDLMGPIERPHEIYKECSDIQYIRDLFSVNQEDIRLDNIPIIIDYIISKKESFKDITNFEIDQIERYFDLLLNNINIASIFTVKDLSDDTVEIVPVDIDEIDDLYKYKSVDGEFDLDDELDAISFIDEDEEEDDSFSEEADEDKEAKDIEEVKKTRSFLTGIFEKALKIKNIIDRGKINITHFIDKLNIPRNLFYQKHLGKIDHLYKNYASEARIIENETNGDPVKILTEKCINYLDNLINGILRVYKEYNLHIDKLFTCKTFADVITNVNDYIVYDAVKLPPEATVKDVNNSLKLDLRYRIANLILEDNEVYGHTVQSIVEKKYPPIQHVIISLFLPRPHEKPVEMSVSDMFESADSFKIMEKKMKDIIKESSTMVATKLGQANVQIPNNMKVLSGKINKYKSELKVDMKTNKTPISEDGVKQNNSSDFKKIMAVLKNHEGILESFIPIFMYVSEAGNVYYNVSVRIDYTTRDAIKSMLNVEAEKTDPGYKTGAAKAIEKKYITSTNPATPKDKRYKSNVVNMNKNDIKDAKILSKNDNSVVTMK